MSDQVITDGKLVSITYRICDETGTLLEQTDLPVNYVHGGRTELIGGMDRVITGKTAGDTVEFSLTPDQGFGRHDPDLTFTDDVENVPPQFRHLGAQVEMQNDAGDLKTFYVARIEGGKLTVDGNHPLAGKALRVRVRIVEVREPTAQELSQDGTSSAPPSLH